MFPNNSDYCIILYTNATSQGERQTKISNLGDDFGKCFCRMLQIKTVHIYNTKSNHTQLELPFSKGGIVIFKNLKKGTGL